VRTVGVVLAATIVTDLVDRCGARTRGCGLTCEAGGDMARYFTADLHLGHGNIIEYCGRPFDDVDEMNAALVDRWNQTVSHGDEVIVLGDLALGRIAETLPLVGRLHGRKVLLAGNHDRCWFGHKKGVDEWIERYLAAGFAEIWQGTVALEVGGRPVLACHFPYRGDSHDQDRFVPHRPADTGSWLLHGHVHERWKTLDRMINVGVDVWDFAPVAEDVVAQLMTARS
jgi:calcineurin-like phosphoesterase family protein